MGSLIPSLHVHPSRFKDIKIQTLSRSIMPPQKQVTLILTSRNIATTLMQQHSVPCLVIAGRSGQPLLCATSVKLLGPSMLSHQQGGYLH